MCQGFGDFSGFLHHFVLAKLATSIIKVNGLMKDWSTCTVYLNNSPCAPGPFMWEYTLAQEKQVHYLQHAHTATD